MTTDVILKTILEKNKDPWWKESESKVLSRYGPIFNPSNLGNLTKEDYKSFLLIKNNLHWEGIHRQGNIVTADMAALRKFLKYVLDENIPLKQRLSTKFTSESGYWVKGVGNAVLSAIFLVVYPKRYGVWNSKSEAALRKLNLLPEFKSGDKYADKYIKINDVLLDLASKYKISLWNLDGVLGDISGNGPFGNRKSAEDLVEEDAEEHGIDDIADFGMESHLEDFLITNWEKTIFSKKYNLIYKDNTLQSQQFNTGVGTIDILAESSDSNEYLVIELKKGRSSDAVVGQILRYMTWIKEHIADGRNVRGIIVVLETDDKLKYSVKDLKNISLYTYHVSFKLSKAEI